MDIQINKLPERFKSWTEYFDMMRENGVENFDSAYVMVCKDAVKREFFIKADYVKARVLDEMYHKNK